ncbi:MAG: glutamate--tRNA ligase [Candidatus Micrarchaeia archaeon]
MDKEELKNIVKKLALKNAIDYGKADYKAVLNKTISKDPESKKDMKGLEGIVIEVVNSVNSMEAGQIEKEFSEYKDEFEIEEQKKAEKSSKPRFELPGAKVGEFATRFPPEPSGYMHIGHAKVAYLEQEFTKIYNGKFFLYFDDTNPEKEKQEYVDQFKIDLEWLGMSFDKEYYASDNVPKIYEYAKELIKSGKAYVCTCEQDIIKRNRFNGIACIHRDHSIEENLYLFEDMLNGKIDEGKAVLRFKGNLQDNNTAMRDPTLIRIKHANHYRQGDKYVAWPTYDLNTPIMDSINGVTDVIRSKEYELRNELDLKILDALGLRKPRIHLEARLVIKDSPTQKRVINKLLKEKVISSYDDPRLATIAGMRRRGITPEAIRAFVLRFGMSKVESYMNMDILLAENRKIIDKNAKRLFFVSDPAEITVEGIDSMEVKLKLHPSNDLGYREYAVGDIFYISGSDAKGLSEGESIRLKDLYNIKIEKITGNKIHGTYIGNDSIDAKKVQWVEKNNYVNAELIIPKPLLINGEINKDSLESVKGYAESYAKNINKDDVVQFERVGFFKLDDVKNMQFIGI